MTLSVVIAASNNPQALERCLESLWKPEQAESEITIIVAANFSPAAAQSAANMVDRRFPSVQYLEFSDLTTVPELRLRGIQAARGEIVALLEDNVSVDADWSAQIVAAHHFPHSAIGGAVENRGGSALDWAAYFYEYGKYMLPCEVGPVDALAGNNVSYKKAALDALGEFTKGGFYEAFLHQELLKQGHQLFLWPPAVVIHDKRYGLRHTLAQCFHHGRAFAGMRRVEAPLHQRVLWAGGAVLLPLILPARIVRRTLKKGRHRAQLGRALPFLLLFMLVWSFGEWCGYWRGAGSSAQQWR